METSNARTPALVGARRKRSERGLALLMTILVLSSLLILGISLSTAVKADFEEAVFYRSYNEAHIRAQEGLANAMGFMMYDVWGVNEKDPFVCSQWGPASALGDKAPNKSLGDTFIADAGGINYAFSYDGAPLLAAELELDRMRYDNVPIKKYAAQENITLVSDWEWVNPKINAPTGAMVNQHENYGGSTSGRSRYTDAFLPTNSDVNDWFEIGIHTNRSDLHGYWRNNFPNRPADIYAGGDQNGWGHTRTLAPVADYLLHGGAGDYQGEGAFMFPFAEGGALNDPVIQAPWNFVNTNSMCGDSFTRVFRSDLVDANYENNTYNAMLMGPAISSANGTVYGGAININEVNNNYELENYPGVITPNDTTYFPVGSPDYQADNAFDYSWSDTASEKYYYSGRSYHYNEAKWVYTYDEMGKPTGRYAVTILSDGGLPNVNSLGNTRNTGYFGWFPLDGSTEGIFPAYDRGYTIFGNRLWGRKSYGQGSNTGPGGGFAGNLDTSWYGGAGFRQWSDETGANFIKNGSIQSILRPGKTDVYAAGATQDLSYWQVNGPQIDSAFRNTGSTSGSYYEGLYRTNFPVGTANITHPKFLAYMAPGELYAGPNKDIGHLKMFGQGIMSHVFWHLLSYGPVRTRSEFMMLLKKRAFMVDDENDNGMAANGLDENPRGNGTFYDAEDYEVAEKDCQYLAGWITPISYHYTLDDLWNCDRVVLDSTADLRMGGNPALKNNCYFWSGLHSQSRNGGDPQSGYEGVCPTAIQDDVMSEPGPWIPLAAGDMNHWFRPMYRKVRGKTGAKSLLQVLSQVRYLGNGMGIKKGGYTAYSPLYVRTDAAGLSIPGIMLGSDGVRRANAAGALALAYILTTLRIPNDDYYDQWRTEMRFGDAHGVVVNWKPAAGGWDPDITIWPNMHWRQAWEVSSKSEWDYYTSKNANTNPTYGTFQLHQYLRSTVTEVGRARVYQPYYQNDLDGNGLITGNNDFRKNATNNSGERLFLPRYEEIPYNQWMTHRPSYAYDMSGIGVRQAWGNYPFPICDNPTIDTGSGESLYGFQVIQLANGADFKVRVRTKGPLPVKLNDEVVITGAPAPFTGSWVVSKVDGPNVFEYCMTAAQAGGTGVGNYGGGGGVVNLRMTGDPSSAMTAQSGPAYTDYAYPEGLPLVMNFIEMLWPPARAYASTNTYNNELGESLCNKSWRKHSMQTSYFRMWVTDWNAANTAGWTNLSDGEVTSLNNASYNNFDSTTVRLHEGQGNSQPFFYVKGRLMTMNPSNPTEWYVSAQDGREGVPLIINMFDQFDPIHFGVSVREADAGGNLQWVNYNTTEFQQRAVQRVFGRLVDMTWGVGEDRIPQGNASIDGSFRWTTRAGNRGMFIRAHSPMFMQRGITLTNPNYSGASGTKAFVFENWLIDMPVTLAFRQQFEKKGTQQGGPDNATGGAINMGAYLCSFAWYTFNRTYGQDCDWPAFYWWNEDGHVGSPAFPGGSNIAYSNTAPIIRWDPKWDRSIDGHHDPFVNAGSDTSNYGVHSVSAGNASMQAMTQGHPESMKVIYFHPYFFPTKIVYGTRSRPNQPVYNNVKYYDYVWPRYTVDNGTTQNSPNWITSITRSGGTVTVNFSNDINGKISAANSIGSGSSITAGAGRMIRVVGCPISSFNGVYPVATAAGTTVTFKQDGLPDATVSESGVGVPATARPAGYCYQHWAFARDFSGGHQMNLAGLTAGVGAWSQVVVPTSAGALPADTWVRSNNITGTAWAIGSYFPVDNVHNGSFFGSSANAQSPVELVERVHGCITLPDYLGIGELPAAPAGGGPLVKASKLWTNGPWWVDGDEGQGAVEMDTGGALAAGDFVVASTGARGRVVTVTGGKTNNKMIIEPCAPYTGGFPNGATLSKVTINEGASPFLTTAAAGAVVNQRGQRWWMDYGRYCHDSINTIAAMDWANVDPVPTHLQQVVYAVPPASSQNTYLQNVLEFSVSTPWVLDNGPSTMWQYNSAYCFKDNNTQHADSIWNANASARVDPAFGAVKWYLAKGTDHQVQVFSLPTPMERNTNHVAWGASPFQRDMYGNGVEPDPNRPGFNRAYGKAAASPISYYVKNKLELGLYQIANATFNYYRNEWFNTPVGHMCADEVDFHELNWWDLNFSTQIHDTWELGIFCGTDDGEPYGGPSFLHMGKDPLSDSTGPGYWTIADPAKQYDMCQNYTNTTSYNDFHDNMNIGVREILTTAPLRGVDPAQGRVEGHYNLDRQSTFKLNPNLIPSPMLYGYLVSGYLGQQQPTYVFGNKPARGFVSSSHMIQYCGTAYSSYHLTNWNSRIWYKHQMIGPSSFNDYFGVNYVYEGYARMSNMVDFCPSPVYTALITGQAINDSGESIAQIRLTVGVERTYDGKCNILEYQINAGMSGVK